MKAKHSSKRPVVNTFGQGMWDSFSSCLPFGDGRNPVYREMGDWLVIADSQCVSALWNNFDDDSREDESWTHTKVIPTTQEEAMEFLRALPKDFTPNRCGFKKD